MRPSLRLPLVIALGVLVRIPFWIEALKTPLDGDMAIVGLMARHPSASSTFWGQPYGSPLDAWIVAPFVAAMGPTLPALRLPYFLLGLSLIPTAYALARTLHPGAALPAAFLMACPPPYFLLLSALPPPLYATTLLLCAGLLLLAFRLGEQLIRGLRPVIPLMAWGALGGLAVWTHLMSLGTLLASATWIVLRARGRRTLLFFAAVPLLLASSFWWFGVFADTEPLLVVRVAGHEHSTRDHLIEETLHLHQPLGGLLGTHVPLIADTADFVIHASWINALGLTLIYGLLFVQAVRASRQTVWARVLVAVVGLTLLAFLVPLRSGPHTIRFLTPLYLPLLALVAWVPVRAARPRRGWIALLTLAVLHLTTGTRLLSAWRSTDRADPPFRLPDLAPIHRALAERGIHHAYASYGPAFRLTFESRETLQASPPWNERFRHYPLPGLDEVRFAKNVAWVLTPQIPSDWPTPLRFEEVLGASGGSWQRLDIPNAVIFYDFVPPFGVAVESWPGVAVASDADLGTALIPDRTAPTTLRLPGPRLMDAVTLVAPLHGPRLPRSMDVEVSADGAEFEIVAQRRRRQERLDLRWVNGHPQAVLGDDLIAIPLGGRPVLALRITPLASSEPWSLAEVLIHPTTPASQRAAWSEWLDPHLSWAERRRRLAAHPEPTREDWYWRMLLAARHPPLQ